MIAIGPAGTFAAPKEAEPTVMYASIEVPARIARLTYTHTVYLAVSRDGLFLDYGFDRGFAKAARPKATVIKLPAKLYRKVKP